MPFDSKSYTCGLSPAYNPELIAHLFTPGAVCPVGLILKGNQMFLSDADARSLRDSLTAVLKSRGKDHPDAPAEPVAVSQTGAVTASAAAGVAHFPETTLRCRTGNNSRVSVQWLHPGRHTIAGWCGSQRHEELAIILPDIGVRRLVAALRVHRPAAYHLRLHCQMQPSDVLIVSSRSASEVVLMFERDTKYVATIRLSREVAHGLAEHIMPSPKVEAPASTPCSVETIDLATRVTLLERSMTPLASRVGSLELRNDVADANLRDALNTLRGIGKAINA